MKNVLLRLCRKTHRMSKGQIACELNITPDQYGELENGVITMTPARAKGLEKLYNIPARYFLESARQLDLLKTREEVIKHLNAENERLNRVMETGYELLHQSRQKAS